MANRFPKTGYGRPITAACSGTVATPMADGGISEPPIASRNDRLRRANSEMVENSRLAQQGLGEAWNTGAVSLADKLATDPRSKQERVQGSGERAMRAQRMKTLMDKLIGAAQGHAEGGVVQPSVGRDGVPDITRLESLMRSAGEQEQSERGARFQSQSGENAANSAHNRMQMLAEMAMRARQGKSEPSLASDVMMSPMRKAEGGVVTPQPSQPTGAMGWAQAMLRKLIANPLESAAKVGNPPPARPPDTDISIVRRAAAQAGERMEAEKAAEESRKRGNFGSYGK